MCALSAAGVEGNLRCLASKPVVSFSTAVYRRYVVNGVGCRFDEMR